MAIPLDQLPADLLYQGRLDVSNPVKQTKYNQLNDEWNQNQGRGSGGGGIDYDGILQKQKQDQADLIARQKGEQTAFLGKYQTGLQTTREQANTELGLPGLRQTTQTAGDAARFASRALQDLPGQLTATGRAASVNVNRLGRGISKGIADLQPGIETARRGLEDATSAQQFGETEYTRRLQEYTQPLQLEASMLSESLGREFSGFTNQMQNELQLTLQKLANSQAVSMAEINRANTLAQSEADYLRQKDLISYQSQQDVSQQQQLKSAGLGSYYSKPQSPVAVANISKYLTPTNASGGVGNQPYGPVNPNPTNNTNSGFFTVGQQPGQTTLPGGITIPHIPQRPVDLNRLEGFSGYNFNNLNLNLRQ